MNLSSAKPGDIVLVDRRGFEYYGEVRERQPRQLVVRPLNRQLASLPSFCRCKSREVIALWHKSRQRASAPRETADVA